MRCSRCAVKKPTQPTRNSSNELRFPIFTINRLRHFLGLIILIILISPAGPTASRAAQSTGKTKFKNATERYKEVDYWDEVHEQERTNRLEIKRQREIKRAEVITALPQMVKEGEAAPPPPEEFEMENVPPPPPKLLDGKRDYVFLSLVVILMGALTVYTLFRHRREREIKILTGKYLSDGTEAAWIQMPALFLGPAAATHLGLDLSKQDGDEDAEDGDEKAAEPVGPVAEFFKQAPELLAQIRKLLPDLNKAVEDAARKQTLLKLHEQIVALKVKADCWDLRPVWQLTSALEMLLKRLAEKCKESTASTNRTVATAIDLLAEICVPGVRPDLIISPPISVLAVDDDPLCLRAVMFALQKAEMTPETAATGEAAVMMAGEKSYDVIFMDIKMPGIDGLRACEQIHELKKNENTPVVFVTALSDFRTRAESTLAGGSDLLIKPFLMFEITVKVLIFTMRKRLGLAASLKREVASLTGASQLDGKATVVLPSAPAATPPILIEVAEAKKTSAPAGGPAMTDVPVNGSAVASLAVEPLPSKQAYVGVELPHMHMAPAGPLEREARLAQAQDNGDRRSRKKRRRELAAAAMGKGE